ncbi:MAG: Obg family GTPase CgtA, partial [Anaeroplasmataceae bacterium]
EDDEKQDFVNYTFKPKEKLFEIQKDADGIYNVVGAGLKKIVEMTDLNREASVIRFTRQLRSFGVDDELRKLGVKDGDIVRVFNFEFEFKD